MLLYNKEARYYKYFVYLELEYRIVYFINSDEWINSIGTHYISFVEKTVAGGTERRIVFENALDADFIFLDAKDFSRIDELSEIVSRAYKILLDKGNFTDIIRRMAEPWVVKEFNDIYAEYSSKDIIKALTATMILFRKISVEIADKCNYRYPDICDNYAAEWLDMVDQSL